MLHGPDYFTVSILIYLDRFMVPTASQSQPSAGLLIYAAEGISRLTSLLLRYYYQ